MLEEEYKPEGPSEAFCVAVIAECMWKQRRLSRSEKRFVVAKVGLDPIPPGPAMPDEQLFYELFVLEDAQKEIASYGNPLAGNL